MGGSTELLIPDNLRSAVSRAHRYEPDTNPTYHDLACHYAVAVLPARVKKPRDKAKAEVGVQVVERWILAALRNRTFFSLAELNVAIAKLLERLNNRPFRKLPGSRRELFEQLDRPALRPLPAQRYVFAQWKKVRVNIDYHVEVDRHYYSVPHALVGRQLDVRVTATTVECLYRGQRVASHVRSPLRGRHITADEHMPEKHRKMGQWSPERLIRWARTIGPHTATLIETVLRSRRHPQQAYRSCLGILRLADSYGEERLEAAAGRAVALGANSYRSVESILNHRLDNRPSEQIELGLSTPTCVARATTPERRHDMLTHPTVDKLHQLRCAGMAKALAEQLRSPQIEALAFQERLGLIVDRELTERASRQLTNRLRRARLRHAACIEDIDFRQPRGLDRDLVLSLADGRWTREHLNCLITGPAGVGKSWISCALAHSACRNGYSASYRRLPRLLTELAIARADARYAKLLASIAKTNVLVIDDWGVSQAQRREPP